MDFRLGRVLPTHRVRHAGLVTPTPTMCQRRWHARRKGNIMDDEDEYEYGGYCYSCGGPGPVDEYGYCGC